MKLKSKITPLRKKRVYKNTKGISTNAINTCGSLTVDMASNYNIHKKN